MEGYVAAHLCNKADNTRLTGKEIKESWGSLTNFVQSYGLKPWDSDDLNEALEISRGMREGDLLAERAERSRAPNAKSRRG